MVRKEKELSKPNLTSPCTNIFVQLNFDRNIYNSDICHFDDKKVLILNLVCYFNKYLKEFLRAFEVWWLPLKKVPSLLLPRSLCSKDTLRWGDGARDTNLSAFVSHWKSKSFNSLLYWSAHRQVSIFFGILTARAFSGVLNQFCDVSMSGDINDNNFM